MGRDRVVAANEGSRLLRPGGRIRESYGFDRFAESVCEEFYARRGRPSVGPGVSLRMLWVGYFNGLCWRQL